MAKKFDMDEMQQTIRSNWATFQERMKEEWAEFREDELAEAKENLHSFIVQVERRTHESADYVKDKLQEWRRELAPKQRR